MTKLTWKKIENGWEVLEPFSERAIRLIQSSQDGQRQTGLGAFFWTWEIRNQEYGTVIQHTSVPYLRLDIALEVALRTWRKYEVEDGYFTETHFPEIPLNDEASSFCQLPRSPKVEPIGIEGSENGWLDYEGAHWLATPQGIVRLYNVGVYQAQIAATEGVIQRKFPAAWRCDLHVYHQEFPRFFECPGFVSLDVIKDWVSTRIYQKEIPEFIWVHEEIPDLLSTIRWSNSIWSGGNWSFWLFPRDRESNSVELQGEVVRKADNQVGCFLRENSQPVFEMEFPSRNEAMVFIDRYVATHYPWARKEQEEVEEEVESLEVKPGVPISPLQAAAHLKERAKEILPEHIDELNQLIKDHLVLYEAPNLLKADVPYAKITMPYAFISVAYQKQGWRVSLIEQEAGSYVCFEYCLEPLLSLDSEDFDAPFGRVEFHRWHQFVELPTKKRKYRQGE